jgi:hypothetical protein
VESVKASFLSLFVVLVEPVFVDAILLDQNIRFALLDTLDVQALAAGKLLGVLLPPSDSA